ncbi:MAG TPA: single-stranded-DNA-specific exonuclease RecJ [Flavobacterium sp.]|jgi:single-stranded-DNA-specific exonuclease|uniref:single-stranded-DNA-specific exonuclease RecJ n=1 Tax=Flavobacterium sp. TaxID=239 RepID=UPI001B753633|nr:single-stranded-DNA-specific exonuclease RecJ [Flavobacterium sp.]MBP7182387.1 single-stranded-DNA-specific exonuclease RecJ [Flavobacterium sp.]MBP7317684.1 single-stranded-DNA-specific exonuclease RecJ [Flavobacterium sp.]MBP8886913.1 single-stranded-DNA-specific exonuclease RecJ [Flavobacterium sp.]HRL70794.1 single-stranded-DNA-specific exonuclease RecJ [Flavobacterium sp.]HRM12239.1 single-stranded-DNA-specific exonuclease RecJ [Flavobacterium sp.]
MRWTLKPKPSEETVQHLAKALNVEDFVATLLVQRGIETFEDAKRFFRPSLDDLHDPYLMKDMKKAVARIENAIENEENILVFGDYDVDGTTAVSLVSSYLKTYYPNVATYIPDRYDEGYGISFKGIDFADDNGFSLIIALDCGIKSIDHVAYAKARNIDFIICDHHRPGNSLPEAVAILDPKRDDCSYPYDELCGCGIGFKLIQALGTNRNQTIDDLIPYLDLVSAAIAADIVPMTGENRVLAYFGLQVINSDPRPGIKAIIHQIKKQTLDITDVVFIIAPRINAAGRIKHGNHAVELLTEFDFEQAQQFASEIEAYNSERKDLDKLITKEALQQIEKNNEKERFTSVVFQENWHKGVIGIVASRLIETYYRPTLVFTKSGDKYAASARSVKGFDVYNALEACTEHLEQFGGHMYAAGMTLAAEKYEIFKDAFEKEVERTIHPDMLTPEIAVDAEINFSDITPKLIRILKQFEPFGPQNMTPIFLTKNIKDTGYGKPMGQEDEHLKLFVKQNNSEGLAAIGFNLGNKIELTTHQKPFQAVYCIDENEWKDKVSLQLRLRDIK